MRAYYAHPISIDGTPQADRDMALIRSLGYEPYPIGKDKEDALKKYKEIGMEAFKPYVLTSHVVIFRAFPDGSIGAGVGKEIGWADEGKIPVLEIPRQIPRRTLTPDETRAMLAELGQR